MFDDFDTQRQSDEYFNEDERYFFFKEYEVDCDDGTQGDVIYEGVYYQP